MKKAVDILLSTFNGEKYLRELIDSVLGQTYPDWTLWVRDDKSTDGTPAIIADYSARYPGKIRQVETQRNLGVIRSFEELLKNSTADRIFFCDQDDVWLPTKVEETLQALDAAEEQCAGIPIGVFTDLRVVDEHLQTLSESFWRYSKISPKLITTFDQLCVHTVATGCTLLINKEAKEASLPFCEETRMHDAWITLNILKNNGKLIPLEKQTVLYRQHGDNVVGAKNENESYFLSRIHNLRAVWENNQKQWRMIRKLGFNSPVKYLYNKVRYIVLWSLKH